MSVENGDRKELQNRIVAIIGRKGSGKSTTLAESSQIESAHNAILASRFN